MSIITYPLNGVTYDAEDVSTYLCTRTSGVYSKDTNYAVSVTGARQITVAPALRGSTTTTSRASPPAAGKRSP